MCVVISTAFHATPNILKRLDGVAMQFATHFVHSSVIQYSALNHIRYSRNVLLFYNFVMFLMRNTALMMMMMMMNDEQLLMHIIIVKSIEYAFIVARKLNELAGLESPVDCASILIAFMFKI